MIRPIVKDTFFLSQKSEPATKADLQVGADLQDTLEAHRDGCLGLAANMIGIRKRIIIVNIGFADIVMFNPVPVSYTHLCFALCWAEEAKEAVRACRSF